MKPFECVGQSLRVLPRLAVVGGLISLFFVAGFTSPAFATSPPVVASVSVPSNGTYIAGEDLDFIVNWSEAVTVGGAPSLALTLTTGGTVQALYVSGSGTSSLVFQYVVAPNEEDLNGVTLGALNLNGGEIQDSSLNNAVLTLNDVASTSGVDVESISPVVDSIHALDPTTTTDSLVLYEITFSQPVVGVGDANFEVVSTGTLTAALVSVVGSGTTYTASVTASGDGTLRLNLVSDGGISDSATNPLVGLFSSGDVYSIDNTPPVVTSVAVPSNATYIAGQDLDFTVNWSESVFVDTTGGTPVLPLTLAVGGPVDATYVSGSGTSALTFRYVVASGNQDLSGVSVGSSLTLNGGSIYDASSNNATLTLAGVASTTGVEVDAIAPIVVSIDTVQSATNTLASEQFTVTFSKAVTGVSAPDFTLVTTGTTSGSVASVTGSGSSYTVTITSVTGVGTLQLDLNSSGTGIADLATNPISGGFTTGETYTRPAPAPASPVLTPPTAQSITISSAPPVHPVIGGTFTLSATGGASGNPVTYALDATSTVGACQLVGTTVTFTGVGRCVIDANQAGTSSYAAAPPQLLAITIPVGHLGFASNGASMSSSTLTFQLSCTGASSCSTGVLVSMKSTRHAAIVLLPVAVRSSVQLAADTTRTVVVRLSTYGRALVAQYLRAHRTMVVLTASGTGKDVLLRATLGR